MPLRERCLQLGTLAWVTLHERWSKLSEQLDVNALLFGCPMQLGALARDIMAAGVGGAMLSALLTHKQAASRNPSDEDVSLEAHPQVAHPPPAAAPPGGNVGMVALSQYDIEAPRDDTALHRPRTHVMLVEGCRGRRGRPAISKMIAS